MNSIWIATAALASFYVGYRFYSSFLSKWIYQLDPDYQTPAHELEDGRDYVPTNKWIVLGHHFTSVAGAAPIVGPAIAIYWGWLPAPMNNPAADDVSWFPLLFITIACGAVSGFHGLVASGTTSKQIDKETDARFVGYLGAVGEGALAIITIPKTVTLLHPTLTSFITLLLFLGTVTVSCAQNQQDMKPGETEFYEPDQ